MITAITDKTVNIELYSSATRIARVNKAQIKAVLIDNMVYLFDCSNSSKISGNMNEPDRYLLDYTKFTVPPASALALYEEIQAMLETGGSGGSGSVGTSTLVASIPAVAGDDVELADELTDRIKLIIFNNTQDDIYVKLGDGATSVAFTLILSPRETYIEENYSGVVTASILSNDGAILVTSILP